MSEWHRKEWKKKKGGKILEEMKYSEREITGLAWKAINVKATSYQSVKKMQENDFPLGKRKQ